MSLSAGLISRWTNVVNSSYSIFVLPDRIHLRPEAPVHEASLLKRHPPLARFTRSIGVQFLDESRSEFLAHLYQILAKVIYIA